MKRAVLMLGAASLLVPSAMAQENPAGEVEQITVVGQVSSFGATKSDVPVVETARSLDIVTADEFIERGALTLDDTLNYTAGVVGDTFGYSTRGDFPAVRGLDVPEFLDNIQVLFGYYNNARSDVYTLEQVEVLKGPASVLYGQGSPGGIVNTISKHAGRNSLEREVVVEYGTHDRAQISADFGADISGDGTWTARFVGVLRQADTQVDYVEDNARVFAPSVTFDNERTRLTALLNHTDRQSDTAHQFLPLAISGCQSHDVSVSEPNVCAGAPSDEVDPGFYAGDPGFNAYDTESTSFTLIGEHRINDVFTVEATARVREADADYRQTWIAFLGAGTPRVAADGTAYGRSWYDAPATTEQTAFDARLRAQFSTGGLDHDVLAGINYQDVETLTEAAYLYALPTSFNVYSPDYAGSEIPDQASFDAARSSSLATVETRGFYIHDQIETGNFILNAGVRFDEIDSGNGTVVQADNATSFSFGALYRTEIGLNPYISYAESFEPVIGVDGVTGNALEPQQGEQIEVGFKYQPAGTRTYITGAYFEIEQTNLPNPADLPGAISQQEGVAEISGFELSAQTVIGAFELDGSVSVIETQDPDGHEFSSVPHQQASAWVTWAPEDFRLEDFRAGIGVRYAGDNESRGTAYLAANGYAPTEVVVETEGYTVVDARIGFAVRDIALSLNARNLFDEAYYGTCLARGDCFPGEGRTVMMRAAFGF